MAPDAPAAEFALYVGPAGNVLGEGYVGLAGDVLGPGGELVPHESVVAVSRGEAEASDYWLPCDAHGAPLSGKRPGKGKTVPSESAGVNEGAGSPSEQSAGA